MTPTYFTISGEVTRFHYKFSELKNFVRNGKEYGNVGIILTKRVGKFFTYRGFGTIENPFTHTVTISMEHSDILDGEMPTDEQLLIPPKPLFSEVDRRIIFLD